MYPVDKWSVHISHTVMDLYIIHAMLCNSVVWSGTEVQLLVFLLLQYDGLYHVQVDADPGLNQMQVASFTPCNVRKRRQLYLDCDYPVR